jgi:hypothetical protein
MKIPQKVIFQKMLLKILIQIRLQLSINMNVNFFCLTWLLVGVYKTFFILKLFNSQFVAWNKKQFGDEKQFKYFWVYTWVYCSIVLGMRWGQCDQTICEKSAHLFPNIAQNGALLKNIVFVKKTCKFKEKIKSLLIYLGVLWAFFWKKKRLNG